MSATNEFKITQIVDNGQIIQLTLIENVVKMLMFKYLTRIMILSIGILNVLVQIIILYGISLIVSQGFHNMKFG